MSKKKTIRTLFLHQVPHYVHEGFAKSIHADFLRCDKSKIEFMPTTLKLTLNGLSLPSYDVYLCDGTGPALSAALKKIFSPSCKVIEIVAHPEYLMLTLGLPKKSVYYKIIRRVVNPQIDGIITVSKFMKENISKMFDVPIKIAYPFISNEMYEKLGRITPNVETHTILSIGSNVPKNGMELLVESFKKVKKEFPDAELYMIGRGHPIEWSAIDGIYVKGFVEDLTPYFEKSSLFVMAGKGQPFPVATLESLRAGLPTIVTEKTGTKEIIRKLGKEFVRKVDVEDIAHGICKYFDMTIERKMKLSKRARELSKPFNEEERCKEFRVQFKTLLEEIT